MQNNEKRITKIQETASNFARWGISCVPIASNKLPDSNLLAKAGFKTPSGKLGGWKDLQDRAPTPEELSKLFPDDFKGDIAIAAGTVFCIDMDEKYNHLDDIHNLAVLMRQRCYQSGLGELFDKCMLAQTPSGGYHLIFRCKDPECKSEKLAWVANPDAGKPTGDGGKEPQKLCTYETRGHKGYFLIAPSRGYKLLEGLASEPRPTDWKNMPLLTLSEKNALLNVCRSFNQVIKETNKQPKRASSVSADETPGDHFNKACRENPDMVEALLRAHGWSNVDNHLWRRPGKDSGISATFNSPDIGGNAAFYVFSSSTDFESEKVYQPWHVFAVLECNGDFAEASRQLRLAGFGGQSKPAPKTEDKGNPFGEGHVGDLLNNHIRPEGSEIVEGSDEWWEQPSKKTLTPVSWPQLEEVAPQNPSTIIEGLLMQRGMCMLSAPSKACKSWTLIDIAMSVATGKSWGGMNCVKSPVLYVNFELLASKMAERVSAIASERDMELSDNLHILNLRDDSETSIKALKKPLVQLCKEKGIKLIIIDPIYLPMIDEALDENLVADVAQFLKQLREISNRGDVALMYAHHFAKGDSQLKEVGDRAAGSSAFGRFVDCQLVLTPPPFGGEYSEAQQGRRFMALEVVQRDFPPQGGAQIVEWKFPTWKRTAITPNEFMKKSSKRF